MNLSRTDGHSVRLEMGWNGSENLLPFFKITVSISSLLWLVR